MTSQRLVVVLIVLGVAFALRGMCEGIHGEVHVTVMIVQGVPSTLPQLVVSSTTVSWFQRACH